MHLCAVIGPVALARNVALKLIANMMSFALFAFGLVGPCNADEVRVAFGDKLPPYCIAEDSSGIEVEIFREALAFRGHRLKPVFLPIKRVAVAFIAKDVDASMIDSGMDLKPYGGIYAEPAVIYDNVFITLAARHISIKKPEDLKGLTVLGFPGALQRYPQWLDAVNFAGNYTERNDQAAQVQTLQHGRYDVVLSDRYIFRYFTSQMKKQQGKISPIEEHDFIVPNRDNYRAIFRDESLKNDYESGLRQLKTSGRYNEIYEKFLK